VNYSTDFKSIRNAVSAQEWQTRLDLAACYRLVDAYGMTDLIYNHNHRANSRYRTPPDQPLRPAVQGKHRIGPG